MLKFRNSLSLYWRRHMWHDDSYRWQWHDAVKPASNCLDLLGSSTENEHLSCHRENVRRFVFTDRCSVYKMSFIKQSRKWQRSALSCAMWLADSTSGKQCIWFIHTITQLFAEAHCWIVFTERTKEDAHHSWTVRNSVFSTGVPRNRRVPWAPCRQGFRRWPIRK